MWPENIVHVSRSVVPDSATPWRVAHQAPPPMGLSRQEYWSGLPFPSPGDLPDPVIKSRSLALQVDSLPSEPPGMPLTLYFLLGGNLHSFTVGLFPSSSKSAMAALVLYTHLHFCGSLSDYS